jgi:hypothetical protein
MTEVVRLCSCVEYEDRESYTIHITDVDCEQHGTAKHIGRLEERLSEYREANDNLLAQLKCRHTDAELQRAGTEDFYCHDCGLHYRHYTDKEWALPQYATMATSASFANVSTAINLGLGGEDPTS